MSKVIHAIVLFGHSNTGKSPLGIYIEQAASSAEQRFHHFDFGEQLRHVAAGMKVPGLRPSDVEYVAAILNGTLLDDARFYIAHAIVADFSARRNFDYCRDILILNGLPRHAGQAIGLKEIGVMVENVFYCACGPEVAWERKLLADQGLGHEDRSGRKDGAYPIFQAKIESFERDTRPLIDLYARSGVPVVTIPIEVVTTPGQAYALVKPHLAGIEDRPAVLQEAR
jgi:adenylate kinase